MSIPESHELRALLLHRLSEAESQALEEQLMADEGVHEALLDAEHDLLDDYASGRLNDDDRAGVEGYLLSTPEARQRLAVAQALARRARRVPSNVSPFIRPDSRTGSVAASAPQGRRRPRRTWQIALAAAASLALLAILLPYGFHRTEATTNLLLLADSERGIPSRSVSVDEPAGDVKLEVEIPMVSGDARYGVDVLDSRGQRIFGANNLHARDVSGYTVVDLIVPARTFVAGARTVVLSESQRAGGPSSVELFRWEVQVSPR